MALGFGFNKQKILASAEKAVQQGKLQNAITEYEKIVKEDPKDLTVLNTIGDLHARVGNNDKASIFFKKVGDIYAAEGFTVKAIAVYKKIAKLNPGASECVLKLAELYTQQGLYNDARSQYVTVADSFMKANNLEEAARIFQKILELDSENTAMQAKLADLYIKLGRKAEAVSIYLKAAQSLHQRGALDAADESLRRVISLDANNIEALLLRGRIAADSGDSASAILYLGKIPDLDARPDALRALLLAELQQGKFEPAEGLASKLLTLHNDATGMNTYAEGLLGAGSVENALRVYDKYSKELISSNPATTIETLVGYMGRITDNVPALELLRSIFVKAGEHARINEVSEQLAHACVQAGDLNKASTVYKELSELEPENPLHLQNYKQIQAKLGHDPTVREVSKEEGAQALMVDELEHQAPALEQSYPDPIREAVKAAVTEAELFESYNMATKAIAPLEGALPKAPQDAQLNQRLASLYARAGRLQEAIERCNVLEKVYAEAGFGDQAAKYVDMAAKYRERIDSAGKAAAVEFDASFMPGGEIHMERPVASKAAAAPAWTPPAPIGEAAPGFGIDVAPPAATASASAAEFSIDVTPPAPSEAAPQFSQSAMAEAAAQAPSAPQGAHEIDLSDWEKMTVEEHPPSAPPAAPAAPEVNVGDLVEEAKFYITQSLWAEAQETIAKLQKAAPKAPEIAELQQAMMTRKAAVEAPPAPAAAEASVAEFSFDAMNEQAAPQVVAPPPPPPPPPKPALVAAAPAPAKPAAPPAKKEEKKDVLSDFVLDLDESLGEDFAIGGKPAATKPAAAVPPPPPKPAPAHAAAPVPAASLKGFTDPDATSTLSDIFAEFKEDVEESADQAEDPDTHYNLGVAFKEMGLLDEAIGELQKVCHAIEKGHPFNQVMQAYTWLAHCFLEKGAPEASVKWYEKALHVPAIDEESKLAVYYELGSAYEAAGNKKLALQNFNEVYSNNIDYRDVAERIKALK